MVIGGVRYLVSTSLLCKESLLTKQFGNSTLLAEDVVRDVIVPQAKAGQLQQSLLGQQG